MTRRTQFLVGAALLAAAVTTTAFFLMRDADRDPARLLTALDAFTGEWEGDAAIQASNGKPLQTLRVTRRYSWVGEKQIVETRFALGAEEYATRSIQWIEGSRLKAVVMGPADEPNTFTGTPTSDGILWTNLDRPQSDSLDRIVPREGQPTVQSASFTPMRLGSISDIVGVAAVLARRKPAAPVVNAEPTPAPRSDQLDTIVLRVADLERKLAAVAQEREELRVRLDRAEQAKIVPPVPVAAPEPVAAPALPPSVAEPEPGRANQLEIKSAPAGLFFAVRRADDDGSVPPEAGRSGLTPATLVALAPGDYTVTLQGDDFPAFTHHVIMRDEVDVVLFHRADRAPVGPATLPVVVANADATPEPRMAKPRELDEIPAPIITVMPHVLGLTQYSGQRVHVSMVVDEHGVPRSPSVTDAPDNRLRDLCLEAITQWRFTPARIRGQPVRVRVTVPFAVR